MDSSKEQIIPTEPTDGCWKAAKFGVHELAVGVKVTPEKPVTESYTVLADSDSKACLPAGEYVFQADEPVTENKNHSSTITLRIGRGQKQSYKYTVQE